MKRGSEIWAFSDPGLMQRDVRVRVWLPPGTQTVVFEMTRLVRGNSSEPVDEMWLDKRGAVAFGAAVTRALAQVTALAERDGPPDAQVPGNYSLGAISIKAEMRASVHVSVVARHVTGSAARRGKRLTARDATAMAAKLPESQVLPTHFAPGMIAPQRDRNHPSHGTR